MSQAEQSAIPIRKMPITKPLRPPVMEGSKPPSPAAGVGVGGDAKQLAAKAAVAGRGQGGLGVGAGASVVWSSGRGAFLRVRPCEPEKEVGLVGIGGKKDAEPTPAVEIGDDKEVAVCYKGKAYRLGVSVAEYKKLLREVGFLPPEPEASVKKDAQRQEAEARPAAPGARAKDLGVNKKPVTADNNEGVLKSAPELDGVGGGIILKCKNKNFRIPISPTKYKQCLQQAGLL